MSRLAPYLFLVLTLAACDTYSQDDFIPEFVVESYLVAGEQLPEVKLSRTVGIDDQYVFENTAVEGASVVVNLLDESGGVEESYAYHASARGIYVPDNTQAVVQPLREYELVVQVPAENATVRSRTIVPGVFDVLEANTDTLVYQATQQLEMHISRSEYPDRQAVYIFTVEAQDTVGYDLTPFYKALVEDEEDLTREDLLINSSPITNEGSYDPNPDGTLTIRLPWIAVAFYGPNRVSAHALDTNLYDFKRSQAGGGTTSPGEMDNLIDHVEGGRGIFGSLSKDYIDVFIQEGN